MKKIFLTMLTAALMLGSVNGYAQDAKADAKAAAKAAKELLKSFNNDLKEAKKLSEAAEKPDFAGAYAAIERARQNANAQDNPDFYFAAGQVAFAQFNNERNKPAAGGTMDEQTVLNATLSAFDNYQTAYDLYKTKGDTKNKNIATLLQNAYDCFNATGAFRANAGNLYSKGNAARGTDGEAAAWIAARNMFDKSLVASRSNVIADYAAANPLIVQANPNFEVLMADSTQTQTAFNRAVCALFSKDHALAIADLEAIKDKDYETNTVMQSLAQEYLAIEDSAKFEALLKEGVARNLDPENNWYGKNLLNIYLDRKEYGEAAGFIDNIIATDPDNATFVDLKGRLLEMQEDIEGAQACYKRATELDPTSASSWSNLGRIYFNKAQAVEDDLYAKKKWDDVDRVAGPMYYEALPFYENAYAFDTERKDNTIANAMRSILYKQFQKPSCPNKKELIAKYNEVSVAYGLPEFK